jgi:hypothetical protein
LANMMPTRTVHSSHLAPCEGGTRRCAAASQETLQFRFASAHRVFGFRTSVPRIASQLNCETCLISCHLATEPIPRETSAHGGMRSSETTGFHTMTSAGPS